MPKRNNNIDVQNHKHFNGIKFHFNLLTPRDSTLIYRCVALTELLSCGHSLLGFWQSVIRGAQGWRTASIRVIISGSHRVLTSFVCGVLQEFVLGASLGVQSWPTTSIPTLLCPSLSLRLWHCYRNVLVCTRLCLHPLAKLVTWLASANWAVAIHRDLTSV